MTDRITSRLPRTPLAPRRTVCPLCDSLECMCRPRYFAGQLLTEVDLTAGQQYVIKKNRLHNLHLHGAGIVCGLKVSCHPSCDGFVRIGEGYAIDPCGDDIVVCDDVDFDVMAAIEECLAAERKEGDCGPGKSKQVDCTPDGRWCLSIEYEEWAGVQRQPLRRGTENGTRPCSCSQGSRCGGATCGNGAKVEGAHNGHNSLQPRTVPTACEPSRWCEGYRLTICRMDDQPRPTWQEATEGSMLAEIIHCWFTVSATFELASQLTTPRQSCRQLEQLKAAIRDALSGLRITRCEVYDALDAIQCARPDDDIADIAYDDVPGDLADRVNGYRAAVENNIAAARTVATRIFVACLCEALIPPCPAPPEDDRIKLASITVENGEIAHVCNYTCRDQLITWPTVRWWLSLLPIGPIVEQQLGRLCCDQPDDGVRRVVDNPQLSSIARARYMSDTFDVSAFGDLFGMAAFRREES